MTELEFLKSRAGLVVSGAASFMAVIGAMRLAAGEPFVQAQADVGIMIGVALVTLLLVVNDEHGGAR